MCLKTYRLPLFLVFILNLFFSLHVSAAEIDSVNSRNSSKAIIYVASGAKIVGAANISNAEIVQIQEKSTVQNLHKKKVSFPDMSKYRTVKREEIDKAAKVVHVKKRKPVTFFYSTSPQNKWIGF